MGGNTSYIQVVAPKYQLPIELVTAIVQVESKGNRFAHRYEAAYDYLWNCRTKTPYRVRPADHFSDKAPADFPAAWPGESADTEWIDQQASFGLMQVMGAVAREYGYTEFLTGLCDPMDGLNYGCKHLAVLRDRYFKANGWRGVVAAYNAGSPRVLPNGMYSNESYVTAVSDAGAKELFK